MENVFTFTALPIILLATTHKSFISLEPALFKMIHSD